MTSLKFDNTHTAQSRESAFRCSSVTKPARSFLWVLHTPCLGSLTYKDVKASCTSFASSAELYANHALDGLARPVGSLSICTLLSETVHASPGPLHTLAAPLALAPPGSQAWEPRHRETPYLSHALFPSWPDGRTSGGYGWVGPGNGSEQLGRPTRAG